MTILDGQLKPGGKGLEDKMKKIVIVMAILLFSVNAWAETEIVVWGAGLTSCGKYLKAIQEDPENEAVFSQWLSGFITGINAGMANQEETKDLSLYDCKGGIDQEALIKWIENYCEENPLDNLYKASSMLINELDSTGKSTKEKKSEDSQKSTPTQ